MIELNVNGKTYQLDVEADTPLLWVVREQLGLTGSKFGCGMGLCGACTMHMNGAAIRTCVMPVSAVVGQEITTIEGLAGDAPHPVQVAWIQEQVPQCGYCQSGQIMAAAALLAKNREPTDADISGGMTNLCRCATYDRIRKGVKAAAALMPDPPDPEPELEDEEGAEVPADAGGAETNEDGGAALEGGE